MLRNLCVGDTILLNGVMRQPDQIMYFGGVTDDGCYALLWKNVNDYINGEKWDVMAAMSSPATFIRKMDVP